MTPIRALRRLRAPFVCTSMMLALAQAALAAAPGAQMTPMLRKGSQELPANVMNGTAQPQYGLFRCQVGLDSATCYDPYQMRRAYEVDAQIAAGFDGTGQTIVIVDAYQNPNLVNQLQTFTSFYGLPAVQLTQVTPDGLTPFDPNSGEMVGWAEEISLDVEWAHAIAPGAKIALVLAKTSSDTDILSAINYAIDHNLGDVISMSFGENESCLDPATATAWHNTLAKATAKNITLFASSGDEGAAMQTCDGSSWTKAVSSPANDPLVTGVGGTELRAAGYCLASLGCTPASNPAPGTYQLEIAWNEGLPYGDFGDVFGYGTIASGGGYSVVFDQPPFQKSTLKGIDQRAVPDVAYSAAVEHGVLTYLSIPGTPAGFYLFGGTSAGAPQWAAITAIANQKNGGRLGFLNSGIYQIGKKSKVFQASFNDITSGANSALEFDQYGNPVNITGYSAGQGWDAATGTGSPVGAGLVDALIKAVSPGDGKAAIAASMPKPVKGAKGKGKLKPHAEAL